MPIEFADFWCWDGTVGRGKYARIGVFGFALKHNLDRFVATLVFHRRWSLFNYWIPPGRAVHITSLPRSEAAFLAAMVAMALPFIWAAVVLTLRRLRDAGLPAWCLRSSACFPPGRLTRTRILPPSSTALFRTIL